MSKLLVGAGKALIDVPMEMYPVLTHFNECQGKYDDCYCRAIAIDNGKRKMMLVIYELSDMPTIPDLKQQIAAACGFAAKDIFCAVTHNHSSICDYGMRHNPEEDARREAYKPIEIAAACNAAKQAVATMRPAHYGYGEIDSYINTNRDYHSFNGYWLEARNLGGYSCKTLAMVKFVDDEGKVIAAILNHETHATCAFLQRDFDGLCKTSGNFPGITCRFVEEYLGGDAIVAWTAGASGNQNPVLSHGLQYEYPDGYTTEVPYPDGVGYMQMEQIGRLHGADACRGLDSITEYSDVMPIAHVHDLVLMPAQKRAPGYENIKGVIRMGGKGIRTDFTPPKQPVLPVMVDDPENPQPMEMELVIMGDIAMVGAGAEIFAEIGRDIKAASPYRKTFVVAHVAEHVGYVLDKSSVQSTSFQAFSNIKPGASDELIVECSLRMFEKAKEQM